MEANIWYKEKDFIYLLQESPSLYSGKTVLENKFGISIQGIASEEEKNQLAETIFNFLNIEGHK